MHTLLVKSNNTFITTNAERIVQRSKLANTIRILVPNEYNGNRMNECLAILYYRLPISGEWKSKELTPLNELYKENYVEYQFQADTWLTAEYGDVEIELKFYQVSMNGDIDINQYVRKVTDGIIHISASKDWGSGIADSLLDTVDQRIIQLMMVQNRQDEMIAEAQFDCATSLGVTDGKIHLVNTIGEQKGEAIDVIMPRTIDDDARPGDGIVELGEVNHDESDPNCDCGCDHDNFEDLDSFVAESIKYGNFSEL
jgi:hypothetical protein